MSRRDNMKRIFVGNLPPDVRERDLEDLFYKFGKIAFIDLKTRRGPPFAFVEFYDYRDAEEAVRCRDGKDFDGCKLRVEFPRGRERTSRFKNGSGSSRSSAPQRRSKFRVKVTGLPSSGSWQDLKDHMREVGEVCFADVYKGGEGVVEFINYDDMRYAIRKLNNTKFKSHEGESSYIKLKEDLPPNSRSRSRSPIGTRRRASPSYSPVNKRRADSHSPSRSQSRSPKPRRGGGGSSHHTSKRARRGRSDSRSRSPTRSRSHSRSQSGSPRSARGSSRGGSRDRSRSPTKSPSRSPNRYDKSPARSDRRSKSNSRSPSPVGNRAKRSSSKDNNNKNSRSRSRSKSSSRSVSRSPVVSKRTPSKTPSRTPTPNRNGSPAEE